MESTFRLEAIEVLKKSEKPLSVKEITKKILSRGNIRTRGKTPHSTLYSIIMTEIKKKGKKSAFDKTNDGLFVLSKKL